MIFIGANVPLEALPHLEAVVASDCGPTDDPCWRYTTVAPGLVTPLASFDLAPVSPDDVDGVADAALVLAACYGRGNRLEDAIGVLQQVVSDAPSVPAVMALIEFYSRDGDHREIVHLTASLASDDPKDHFAPYLRLEQADALMFHLSQPDAALEVYNNLLRNRHLEPQYALTARYCRGIAHTKLGQEAAARKDFLKVYAENPDYLDVANYVEGTSASGR